MFCRSRILRRSIRSCCLRNIRWSFNFLRGWVSSSRICGSWRCDHWRILRNFRRWVWLLWSRIWNFSSRRSNSWSSCWRAVLGCYWRRRSLTCWIRLRWCINWSRWRCSSWWRCWRNCYWFCRSRSIFYSRIVRIFCRFFSFYPRDSSTTFRISWNISFSELITKPLHISNCIISWLYDLAMLKNHE